MSLTSELKDELVQVVPPTPKEARAELATLLRFASALHVVSQRIVVEPEVDHRATALRVQLLLQELFRAHAEIVVVSAGGIRHTDRYVLRVVEGGRELARQVGLIDSHGRPVRGLPPNIVSGSKAEAAAAWRGAFLARGSLTAPGRSGAIEIGCPGPEVGLALVGVARRLQVSAKSREIRGANRVVIREGDMVVSLLNSIGASKTAAEWQERRQERERRGSVNRLANFDDANLRRSAQAAVAASARVERAFEILGEEIPEHLIEAGRLRLNNREASLEELGKLAVPPLTKDAVAGRIRRLLALADKTALERGIPDTNSVLSPDLQD